MKPETNEEIKNTAEEQTETISQNNLADDAAAPEQTTAQTDEATQQTPEQKIETLEAKIAELQNAMLYKVAEFDNYRKRTIKEKADLILNGGKKVLEAMLPVVDDLERAESNLQSATDIDALREGLDLVFQKFRKVLEGQGLKKMEVIGQDFCTDYHEAVAFVPGQDQDKGKVIDCIQNGYKLNEQVIRYAKVAVGQ